MKTLKRLSVILLIAVCAWSVMPQNVSVAASSAIDVVGSVTPSNPDQGTSGSLASIVGRLLGFLQVASGLVAILMLAVTGFNYIIATPDVKDEMKKKMLPIIIGIILVFGAVSFAKFIMGVVIDTAK